MLNFFRNSFRAHNEPVKEVWGGMKEGGGAETTVYSLLNITNLGSESERNSGIL